MSAVIASFFFAATLVSDAMTALDSTAYSSHAPASLRGTSLALVAALASPILLRPASGLYGTWQRPVLGSLLLVVALLGLHVGGPEIRTFDAIFVTVVGYLLIFLYSSGAEASDKAIATSSVAISNSLMLYASMRILRAGLAHSSEVAQFHVAPTSLHNASAHIATLGYAVASETATVAVSFGGALGMGAAILIASRYDDFTALSLQLGVAATFMAVAALAAVLSQHDQLTALTALYGETACKGTAGVCKVAAVSRRFAVANAQAPGLWLMSLGLFLLARHSFAPTTNPAPLNTWSAASSFAVVATALALGLVFVYSDFAGDDGATDFVLLSGVAAAYVCTCYDTLGGQLVFALAFLVETVLQLVRSGVDRFQDPIYAASVIAGDVLLIHTALSAFLLWWPSKTLHAVLDALTVAGTSLAVGVYLAATCARLAYSGAYEDVVYISRQVFENWLPVFIWAPIAAQRPRLLSRTTVTTIWVAILVLVLVVWFTLGRASTALAVDASQLVGCGLAVAVSWLATSAVV